jgi:hypothetical protein
MKSNGIPICDASAYGRITPDLSQPPKADLSRVITKNRSRLSAKTDEGGGRSA